MTDDPARRWLAQARAQLPQRDSQASQQESPRRRMTLRKRLAETAKRKRTID